MKSYIQLSAIFATSLIFSACDRPAKTTPVVSANKPATPLQPVKATTGNLIGVWYDEEIKTEQGQQIAYEVISKGKQIYIQAVTFTGTKFQVSDVPEITPAATKLKKNKEGYVNIDNPTELYKVDENGNLLIYDHSELVMKCTKLL